MRTTFFLSLLFVFSNTIAFGQSVDLKNAFLKDSLEVIAKRIDKYIMPARYMEKKLIARTDTMEGWEGTMVSLYEYSVDKGKKTGRVYMANADSKKLAAWIITTCVAVTNKLAKKNTDYLIKSIGDASGGQFPVKGIVYENMDGKGFYPYVFKDGVTVILNKKTTDDLTLISESNVKQTKKFARIISTTRQEYNLLFPEINTNGNNWRKVVREEYRKALNSDTNNLMIAWAKGKIK